MWPELLQHGKGFIVEFCRRLRGADRRAFQAEVATEVCGGSPRRAESMLGWSRKSVEKGLIEQQYDIELQPHFDRRGRRACEVQSPVLADEVTDVSFGVSATLRAGRHGRCRSRTPVKAADHDMHPEAKLVPLGILEVDSGQLFLSLGQRADTSDFIADGIEDWWLTRREAHRGVRKIVIDLHNGPKAQSHRTQFMKRLLEFADKHPLEIVLAYYPPYHSNYNPVERCWSSWERHWNGTLLIDVVCNAPRHCRDGAW